MAINILKNYRFREEVYRQTMTIDFAAHLELGLEDLMFSGDFSPYLRTIDIQLRNEFNWNNSRWGIADTYVHTVRVPPQGGDNGRRRRNDSYRTLPRNNRRNRGGVYCAFGESSENEEDNEDYPGGDWG